MRTILIRQHKINNQIRVREVRVLDEENQLVGVMSIEEALTESRNQGKDLVLIAEMAVPPVVKIIDYGKFQYLENKKQKKSRLNAHAQETKQLQVKIATGEHDLELKAKQASKFLKEGHRVKEKR